MIAKRNQYTDIQEESQLDPIVLAQPVAFVDFPPLRDLRVLLCKFLLYLEQTAGFFD
jgi:hypothetical protein